MDREAFKLRMKSLKSYRELNPGKGYWDWRNNLPDNLKNTDDYEYDMRGAYESGALPMWNENDQSYHLPSRDPKTGKILKKPGHATYWEGIATDIKEGYYPYSVGDDTYTRNPLKELAFGNYRVDALAGGGVADGYDPDKELKRSLNLAEYILKYKKLPTDDSQVIDQYIDKVIWPMENPENVGMRDDGLYYVYTDKGGDGITRKNIGPGIESHSNMGKKLKYDNSQGYTKDELNNIVSEDLQKGTARIVNSLNTMLNGRYYGVWDTLSPGPKMTIYDIYHNVKAGNRKNLPEKWPNLINALSKGDLEEAKKQTYSGSTRRLKLRNGLLKYAEGGETDGLDEEAIKLMNLRLGRSVSGRPLELGLKPAITPEDLVSFMPVLGDIQSVAETADAVANKDWIGAGLAAIGVLPFVPSGLSRIGKIKRSIPEVHKNTQDLIDAKVAQLGKVAEDRAKFANEQYRIVERVMEDPSYLNRAAEVKQKFGDDYSVPYADMFIAYNTDPSSLPQVNLINDLTKAGTMGRTPNGFAYGRNPNVNIPNVGEHELSHFTDLLKSGTNYAEEGNNMFYQMSKDLNKRVDSNDKYFSLPTEQKAHMNQFREWAFQNGLINTRDLKVTPEYMSKMLKQLDDVESMKGVKRASLQFKSNRTYTKWFNSIPLISATALGANAYFTNNNNNNN